MRSFGLIPVLLPAVASAAGRGGSVSVEAGAGDMTPWLALAALSMVATLIAAHRLVSRKPRR